MKVKLTSRLFYTWMILAFAAFGITGSQCARVGDRVTGADTALATESREFGACVATCNQSAAGARMAENDRFRNAIRNCTTDECRNAEVAFHQAILEEVNLGLQECKSGCHEQGSGSGGQ